MMIWREHWISNHFRYTCVLHSLGIVTRFVAERLPPFLEERRYFLYVWNTYVNSYFIQLNNKLCKYLSTTIQLLVVTVLSVTLGLVSQ